MCPLLLGLGSSKPSTSLLMASHLPSQAYHVCLSSSSRQSIKTSRFCLWRSRLDGGWSGGALPRWRPPLTPSFFIFGLYPLMWLYGQVCALLAWCGIRVLALSHCINRGFFSSIGIGFLAQKLQRISTVTFCLRLNKVDDFGGQSGSSMLVMIHRVR